MEIKRWFSQKEENSLTNLENISFSATDLLNPELEGHLLPATQCYVAGGDI
jgi:hypothetical protein